MFVFLLVWQSKYLFSLTLFQVAGPDNLQRRRSLDSMSSQSELDYETCDSGLSSERSSNGGRESNGGLSDGNASDSNDAARSNTVPAADGNTRETLAVGSNSSSDLVRSASTDAIKSSQVPAVAQNTASNHLVRSASSESVKTRRQTVPGIHKGRASFVRIKSLLLIWLSDCKPFFISFYLRIIQANTIFFSCALFNAVTIQSLHETSEDQDD